jgi:hypothetical protein
MGAMVSELRFCCSGGQKRFLLPPYSGEHALQCEGETTSVQLANFVNIICEGVTEQVLQS